MNCKKLDSIVYVAVLGVGLALTFIMGAQLASAQELSTDTQGTSEVTNETGSDATETQSDISADGSAKSNAANATNANKERATMQQDTAVDAEVSANSASPVATKKGKQNNNPSSTQQKNQSQTPQSATGEKASQNAKANDTGNSFGLNIAKRADSSANVYVQAALSKRVTVRLKNLERRLSTLTDRLNTHITKTTDNEAAIEAHSNAQASIDSVTTTINNLKKQSNEWITFAMEEPAELKSSFKEKKTAFKKQVKEARSQLRNAHTSLMQAVTELQTEKNRASEDSEANQSDNNETEADLSAEQTTEGGTTVE